MLIVLLGPPAAGKGTQAGKICKSLNLPHIAAGEILRQNIKNKTMLGGIAESFIAKGNFVPDDVVVAVFKDRLLGADCKKGCLLDGFPRTKRQAEELDKFADVDVAVYIDVRVDNLIERVIGRRSCSVCGNVYHTSSYHKDTCNCGGELYTRDDDTEATFLNRIDNYCHLTIPVKEYYEGQGKLVSVSGDGKPDEVFAQIEAALAGYNQSKAKSRAEN